MKIDLFKEYCDLYGGSLSLWPEAQRAEAEILLAQQSLEQKQAVAYLAQTQSLEKMLNQQKLPQIDIENMSKRIVNVAVQQQQITASGKAKSGLIEGLSKLFGFRWKTSYVFAPSGSLMALALLGFWIGTTGGMSQFFNVKSQDDYLMDPVFYAESSWDNEMEELIYIMSEEDE